MRGTSRVGEWMCTGEWMRGISVRRWETGNKSPSPLNVLEANKASSEYTDEADKRRISVYQVLTSTV